MMYGEAGGLIKSDGTLVLFPLLYRGDASKWVLSMKRARRHARTEDQSLYASCHAFDFSDAILDVHVRIQEL